MSEFKVGDKVRIVSESGGGYGAVCKGCLGEVEEVVGDGDCPNGCEVRFFHPGHEEEMTLYFFSHEIERVAPDPTLDYGPPQVGDYIKATHKENPKRTVTGVMACDQGSWIETEDAALVRCNWDFKVLERPEPEPEYELPTEPGVYAPYTEANRRELEGAMIYNLDEFGNWTNRNGDAEVTQENLLSRPWKLRRLTFEDEA